jgi:hypothetical protein
MGADPKICHPVDGVRRELKVCFVGQRYADRDRWLAALVKADVPIAIYGSGWCPDEDNKPSARKRPIYLGREQLTPGTLSSYLRAVSCAVRSAGVLGGLFRVAAMSKYRSATRKLDPLLCLHAKGRAGDLSTTLSGYEVCLNLSNVWADGFPLSPLLPHVRLRDFEAPMCRTCYLTGHSREITEFYEIGREIDTYRSKEELVDKTRFYLRHPETAERLREAGWQRARRDHTWQQRFVRLFRATGLQPVD